MLSAVIFSIHYK